MSKKIQWLIFLICVVLFIVVFWFTQKQIENYLNRPLPAREVPDILPSISVQTVETQGYQAHVTAYGAVEPRYTLDLAAQVSGQVLRLSEQFEPGLLLNQGQTLLWIDDSEYRAAVAQAEQQLAQNTLALLEEERLGMQAGIEWLASGISGEPDSDLVLRKPQMASAQAAVNFAQSQLAHAQRELDYTQIKAPFSALVVSRHVVPGSQIQTGTALATLNSVDRVEVRVALSEREWQQLPALYQLTQERWPVKLQAVEGHANWQGYVLRSEQHLDGTTRQRSLVIAVDQPLEQTPALYPGTFVEAGIPGRFIDDLWRIPVTSLSQRGEVWHVTPDGILSKFAAETVFSDSRYLYITAPDELSEMPQSVVIQPLSSYLEGMRVNPVTASTVSIEIPLAVDTAGDSL